MPLTDEDVQEILRIIDESELDELRVETRGFSLHLRRDAVGAAEGAAAAERIETPRAPPVAADGARTIEAPMLGTFYRAGSPGEEPFVDVGSRVEPDTVVCIIEVMKMMNSIPAGMAGTIVEVCAENAQQIEEGAPLFRVEPA